MSLFFTETGVTARKTKAKPKSRTVISVTEQKMLNCSHCPLDKIQLNHPKMPPTGAANPILYFLGEAPGKQEDEEGIQFIGASGQILRDKIPAKWEKKIRWNNTLRCRPPSNRDPEPMETACCRKLQVADIEQSKPKVVVGFGNVPLEWMLGPDRQISNWRGRRAPVKIGTHTCWFYAVTHPASILRSMHDKKKGAAYLRAFERDLERVFKNIDKGLPDPYVESDTDYKHGVFCLNEYGQGGLKKIELALSGFANTEHAIDIETDRLRPYHPDSRILSVAVGDYNEVFAFPWQHPEARWDSAEKKKIHDLVREYLLGQGRKWAHGAKFEQEWFQHRFGPDVLYKTTWGDTLGQAHVLDERKGKSLDELTQRHFGFRIKSLSPVDVKQLATTPLHYVLPYNGMDTKYCDALHYVQSDLLEEEGLTEVYEFLNEATPALVMMQAKGVVRSLPDIKKLDKDLDAEEEQIKIKIINHPDVVTYRTRSGKFSPTSNPDLVGFFRDYLKLPHPSKQRNGGAWHKSGWQKENDTSYSVDEGALSQFKHPVAKLILDMRSCIKCHGYVTPLLEGGKYVHGDGLIHSSYSNYITVSGRLAAEEPNAQNYPRREHKEIRRVVGCPPGHKFVAFDYGQLEWRIGAMLSGDPVMGDEIIAGVDIHGVWTDQLGEKFVPKKLKENRKAIRDAIKGLWTFANLYGNDINGIAYDMASHFKVDILPRDIEPFYTAFWLRYPLLKSYQEKLMSSYWKLGYAETGTGQRRREPAARNELINHPFQGTAGHLVIDAQRRLSIAAYEQDRPSLQPVMNIHDDLSAYFPEKTIEDDIETTARYMCCCPFDFVKNIPLSVEVSIGDNWCDRQEIATFTTRDFIS